MIQQMLAIWSLVLLPFLNLLWIFWKFSVHVLLKPGLENFEHYFASVWDECICAVVWAFFGIACLWHWNETDLFQSCDHCWVFQICWYIECSTFTASSCRIWNSSTRIPSPPLALFIVMLPKAHSTSHSRMSGSRWVITPSWWSGSWRSFLYIFFCVFLPPLNSFCFCYVHTIFVLYCALLCMKCSLDISDHLEEISSLSHFVFLYFFALITKESFLISPCIATVRILKNVLSGSKGCKAWLIGFCL